jgi:hypothetical protein
VAEIRGRSGLDRVLRLLQTRGISRGLFGGSRGWFYVLLGVVGLRQLRKRIGSVPDVVYQGELRPGETILIGHKAETYEGKAVRSRRRRPVSR